MRYVYWSADSAPIGDTEGRGRVDAVGDRCRPEYCRDRQLISGRCDWLIVARIKGIRVQQTDPINSP